MNSRLLESIVDLLPPSETVLWSGAGVSINAPTRLPSGVDLTRRALQALFAPGTCETIESLYADFDRRPPLPRLETVLGIAAGDDVHGLAALELLAPVHTAPPNSLHRCLAAHLDAGGSQITTNFDKCIERAVTSEEAAERLLHPHGIIDDLESVRRGASVAALDRGFDAATSEALLATLNSARLLVFVGYSGSDFFDVDPLLQAWAAAGNATGRTVLWIQHRQPEEGVFAAVGDQTTRRQLRELLAGNAHVVDVAMPTADVLNSLVNRWKLPVSEHQRDHPATDGTRTSQFVVAGERERSFATLRLYHHLGAPDLTERALRSTDVPSRNRHEISADGAWGRGQYRTARHHWKEAWPEADSATQLRRLERIAATHWVQGRLAYATCLLIQAIRASRSAGMDPAPAAETLLHVARHLRRSPEWSLFPVHRLERWAKQYLPDPTERQGTHLDVRYSTLRSEQDSSVGGRVAAHASAAESFREYEALNGVLNYEHGRLRRLAEAGQCPRAEDYVRVRRWASALGRSESAFKVLFLPGAEAAFSRVTALWAALTQLEVTPWQRLRFVLVVFGRTRLGRSRRGRPVLRP